MGRTRVIWKKKCAHCVRAQEEPMSYGHQERKCLNDPVFPSSSLNFLDASKSTYFIYKPKKSIGNTQKESKQAKNNIINFPE